MFFLSNIKQFQTSLNALISKIWAILGYVLLYLPISGYLWISQAISGYLCLFSAVSSGYLGLPWAALDCPGIFFGLSLDFPWIISRLSMDYPWIIPALLLEYSWSIPDYP